MTNRDYCHCHVITASGCFDANAAPVTATVLDTVLHVVDIALFICLFNSPHINLFLSKYLFTYFYVCRPIRLFKGLLIHSLMFVSLLRY